MDVCDALVPGIVPTLQLHLRSFNVSWVLTLIVRLLLISTYSCTLYFGFANHLHAMVLKSFPHLTLILSSSLT